MTTLLRATVLIGIAAFVSACEAQCSVSTASLTEAGMAAAVDPETKAPTAVMTAFPAGSGSIYATAKVSNAPDETMVRVTFHYLEDGDMQITEAQVSTGGTRHVMFTLNPPANGWPIGRYETRFFLNGEEKARVPFTVGR